MNENFMFTNKAGSEAFQCLAICTKRKKKKEKKKKSAGWMKFLRQWPKYRDESRKTFNMQFEEKKIFSDLKNNF
jgi:hypothetical protein